MAFNQVNTVHENKQFITHNLTIKNIDKVYETFYSTDDTLKNFYNVYKAQ